MSDFTSFFEWALKPIFDFAFDSALSIEIFGMPIIYALLMFFTVGILISFIAHNRMPGGLGVLSRNSARSESRSVSRSGSRGVRDKTYSPVWDEYYDRKGM